MTGAQNPGPRIQRYDIPGGTGMVQFKSRNAALRIYTKVQSDHEDQSVVCQGRVYDPLLHHPDCLSLCCRPERGTLLERVGAIG